DMEQSPNWSNLRNLAHRSPNVMQILVSGLHFDIGRYSTISTSSDVKLRRSTYSDEPLFAIFRVIDLTFIIQIVFSLFAILYTYDSINGERELGTLKLSFANPLSRVEYLISKITGIWLSLIIPFLLPFLLCLLVLQFTGIPFTNADWLKILMFTLMSILYLTFFVVCGVMVSSFTSKSSFSFMILLVIWISGVLILPRLGVSIAGEAIPVPSIAQMESRQEAYRGARWDTYGEELSRVWSERNQAMQGMSEEEQHQYRNDNEWTWMVEDDQLRREVQEDITENNRRLIEEADNLRKTQQNLAMTLARISPAGTYFNAAMSIAGTNLDMKNRYLQAMREYRDRFTTFVNNKQAESGERSGMTFSISSSEGVKIDDSRDDKSLDLSGLPNFNPISTAPGTAFIKAAPDFIILLIFTGCSFGLAFYGFLRYDMR
ncbi:MAG TPA: ABC transporter permease subunit, partial [Bacteroidales bacterium]|nr:ABC transporter permease subunit [Bacteroidales bacterium]